MKLSDILNKQGTPPGSAKPGNMSAGCFSGVFVIAAIAFLIVALPVWYWFWWRIEPGNGELAV